MWTHYRRWKPALVFPLAILALFLMRGQPEDALRWKAGIALAALLGTAYLAEEILWIAQNRGRPCGQCGQRIQLRPFTLRIRCPHCGYSE